MSSIQEEQKTLSEQYPVYFGIGGAIVVTGTLFDYLCGKTRKTEEILESEDKILDEDNETQSVSPTSTGAGSIDILCKFNYNLFLVIILQTCIIVIKFLFIFIIE